MADNFFEGKISSKNPFYHLAWALWANLWTSFGHIEIDKTGNPEKKGHEGIHTPTYNLQVCERGAITTERLVDQLVVRNWQHKPFFRPEM